MCGAVLARGGESKAKIVRWCGKGSGARWMQREGGGGEVLGWMLLLLLVLLVEGDSMGGAGLNTHPDVCCASE